MVSIFIWIFELTWTEAKSYIQRQRICKVLGQLAVLDHLLNWKADERATSGHLDSIYGKFIQVAVMASKHRDQLVIT